MNWMARIAIFAQQFFFCEISCAVAGSVLIFLLLMIDHFKRCKYSHLHILWIKLTIILSLVPVTAFISFLSRTDYQEEGIIQSFSWWMSTTASMKPIYTFFLLIWFSGLGVGIIIRLYQYYQLKHISLGNIEVEDEYQSITMQYKDKYSSIKLNFYQNDLLESPIVTGIFHPKIILPVRKYSEKELHMILQHEISHVQRHDLIWKHLGLTASFIHWWNPLIYIMLEKLVLWEEIECDEQTCINNPYFTRKEYGMYLAGMEENGKNILFASAWSDSKKDMFRRLEVLARGTKYSKKIAVVSCMVLALLSVTPAYAASEGMMEVNEIWAREGESETKVEDIDYAALECYMHVSEEPNVIEIEVETEEEISLHSTLVTLDQSINANIRMLYRQQAMQEGDVVFVDANCSDNSITYRIGIKDESGNLVYKEGNGKLSHVFTISSDGNYRVYVENRSDKTMQVTGSATYPN